VLEGITRSTIVTLAVDLGFNVVERQLSRDELYTADEVFVCGTACECIGLREIDFRIIGSGVTGRATRALQREFHSAVHGTHRRSPDWLDWIRESELSSVRRTGSD
jgi:branched-chain amino acid aminotransferase